VEVEDLVVPAFLALDASAVQVRGPEGRVPATGGGRGATLLPHEPLEDCTA
jgi:hypothetical protein